MDWVIFEQWWPRSLKLCKYPYKNPDFTDRLFYKKPTKYTNGAIITLFFLIYNCGMNTVGNNPKPPQEIPQESPPEVPPVEQPAGFPLQRPFDVND